MNGRDRSVELAAGAGVVRLTVRRAPVVVIGAGVAGLSAALSVLDAWGEVVAGADGPGGQGQVAGIRRRSGGDSSGDGLGEVVVLADRMPGEGGSSPWAQGGMAAAVGPTDRTEDHAADTVAAGAELVDPVVARAVADAGPAVVGWLQSIGTRFDRDLDGGLALGREAAHGRNRIVHAKDATGAELVRALNGAARRAPGLRIEAGQVAVDLLREGERVVGVLTRSTSGQDFVAWLSPAVVLATGGYAHLWAVTTTPPQAVGDGLAMAARAGAALADLEFVQFHPTALAATGGHGGRGAGDDDQVPLLTEALRGDGAVLVDEDGRRFCDELAPRDVVARAIYGHLAAGHRAFLDARALGDRLPEHFPTVFARCAAVGLDPRRDLIPTSPAAHYCMGGVVADVVGRTSLAGLWVAGEVSATGLHGANRLASNSLLEGVVMGRNVGADIGRALASGAIDPAALPISPGVPGDALLQRAADPSGVVADVRRLLWDCVGVRRDAAGLERAGAELDALAARAGTSRSGPGRNAVLVARLVVAAANARRESRGAHQRTDFPSTDDTLRPRRVVVPEPAPLVRLPGRRAVAA